MRAVCLRQLEGNGVRNDERRNGSWYRLLERMDESRWRASSPSKNPISAIRLADEYFFFCIPMIFGAHYGRHAKGVVFVRAPAEHPCTA